MCGEEDGGHDFVSDQWGIGGAPGLWSNLYKRLISNTTCCILQSITERHSRRWKICGSVSCRGMRTGDIPRKYSNSSISIELAKLLLASHLAPSSEGYTAVVLQVAPLAHRLASKTTLRNSAGLQNPRRSVVIDGIKKSKAKGTGCEHSFSDTSNNRTRAHEAATVFSVVEVKFLSSGSVVSSMDASLVVAGAAFS